MLSVLTAMVTLGPGFVLDHIVDVKGWLDQFIVFFTFVALIPDRNTARRRVVYILLTALVVLALGFTEWLEKRTVSSIERAPLLGAQMQPNDFGAFLAYMSMPFVSLLLNNLRCIRIWIVTVPYVVVMAKILLVTFSCSAYIAIGLAGVVAGYVRGKLFLLGSAVLAAGVLLAMPQLVPISLAARMSQTSSQESYSQELDSSSQTRLILWKAEAVIILESPVSGCGFKAFQKVKGEYTEQPVHESDSHNIYLYLSSQMGIHTLVLFLLILWRIYLLSSRIHRGSNDGFTRAIGMGAAALAAATAVVNKFDSRITDICVTAYFCITFAMIARLWMEIEARNSAPRAS